MMNEFEQYKVKKEIDEFEQYKVKKPTQPEKKEPWWLDPAGATLETIGLLGGATLGAPAGPIGAIGGAGLLWAAAKQIEKRGRELLGYEQLQAPEEAFKQAAIDIPTGAAIEAGGAIVPGIVGPIGQKGVKLAQRLYGSAIKAPISKKWTRILPGKEVSDRIKAIERGLEDKIRPSGYGSARVDFLEKQTKQFVDDIVDIGAQKGYQVETEEIIRKGLKKAYTRAESSSDPIGAKKIVDEIANKFRAHGEIIKVDKLNAIKRQLYDEVKWGGSEQTALVGQLNEMGKKGMAHEAMKAIENFFPEVAALNKKDSAYILLKESLERALGRMQNKDIVDLGSKALAVRSLPLAIFNWTIGHPQVKTSLAFTLSKSQRITGEFIGRPLAYTLGQEAAQ